MPGTGAGTDTVGAMTITSTPPEIRPARRIARAVLLWLLVVSGLGWAAVRLLGLEWGPVVQLFAFTPYAAVGAWIPVMVALGVRRRLIAAVAAVAAVVLAMCVLPRAVPDAGRGPESGVRLIVMTLNLFAGATDARALVDLVRANDVAALAVQELTPAAASGLGAAGLGTLLPYHALADEPGTTGSGLYSRYPISSPGSQRGAGGNLQAYATVRAPRAGPLRIESAHPLAPYAVSALAAWETDLAAEPPADPRGTPRILLGDFNATLDHAPLRELVARGYRDAADAAGKGLTGTWGPYRGRALLPVTIDHVLVDKRIGVRDVEVHDVAGSDHRAIVATLTVPAVAAGG